MNNQHCYLFKFYANKITAYATFLLYSLSTTIAIPVSLTEFYYIPIFGCRIEQKFIDNTRNLNNRLVRTGNLIFTFLIS